MRSIALRIEIFFAVFSFLLLVFTSYISFKFSSLLTIIPSLLVLIWLFKMWFRDSKPVSQIKSRWYVGVHFLAIFVFAIVLLIAVMVEFLSSGTADFWALSITWIGLYIFSFRIDYWFKGSFIVLRGLLVVVLFYLFYFYCSEVKAVWNNQFGRVYNLTERPYKEINSGGWDWGESWLSFKANSEDLQKILHELDESIYGGDTLFADSILQEPIYYQLYAEIDPYDKITEPCEHWYLLFKGDSFIEVRLHLYYHRASETVMVLLITEQ
jgi:hypothetical protein